MEKGRSFTRSMGVILVLLVVCAVFLATSITAANAAAPAKKLKIGMIACLTGFFAVHDIIDANESQIAAEMINERGGITVKGEKYLVEVDVEDGKSTLDGITAAANRLVFDKGYKIILGPAGFFSGASSPVTTPNKVLDIISFCTMQPGELDASTPYTFMAYNATVGHFFGTLSFLKKHYPSVKKVAIVEPDDGAVPYLAPIFTKALQQSGFTQVGKTIAYANELQDFSPIAGRLAALSKDIDAVLQTNGLPPQVGSIIKGLKEQGYKKPYFQSTNSSLQEVVRVTGKEAAKGVVINGITPNDPLNPKLMNELSKRVTTKYGPDTTMYAQGANSLWVLKQVIEAAQSLETDAIKAKWESMDKVETFFGPGKVCGDATQGIKHHLVTHPSPFQVLKDGKVVCAGYSEPVVVP